jgi:hypothetical protein
MSWSPTVVSLLEDLLPEAAARLFAGIQSEVPVYSGELEEELGTIAETGVQQALAQFMARLVDPEAVEDPRWRLTIAELGRSAQRSGRSLEDLLAAYRVGARVAWREIAQAGARAGVDPEELYRLAEELFLYIDQLSSASAEGFAAEQAQAAGERQRRRRALAALLLHDTPPDPATIADAAHDAGWPVAREIAAVVLAGEDPERLAGRISPETLASSGDAGIAILLVPDPMAPGRLGAIRAAIAADPEPGPAALGPTVTIEDCRRSADRATRALTLAREGILPADGLIVSDEHLLTLLVHRDESLLADIATAALRPLNEISPKARAKLVETLRAYLDHEGRMDPAAHALGVHPQTVRYRVAQARELFGTALDDPEQRLMLSVALRRFPGGARG